MDRNLQVRFFEGGSDTPTYANVTLILISIRHNLLLFTFHYEIPCSLPKCEYARGKVSPSFTHFLLECLGPEVPYTVLVSLTSGKIGPIFL